MTLVRAVKYDQVMMRKKTIHAFLAFLFSLPLLASSETWAAPTGGATVVVRHNGNKYVGSLVAVSSGHLVISPRNRTDIIGFPVDEVDRLKIRRGGFLKGALYGAGAGALLSLIGLSSNSGSSSGIIQVDLTVPILTVFTAGGAVIGGTVGALTGGKVFKLARMSQEKRDAALVKIRPYAAISVPDLQQKLESRMILIKR